MINIEIYPVSYTQSLLIPNLFVLLFTCMYVVWGEWCVCVCVGNTLVFETRCLVEPEVCPLVQTDQPANLGGSTHLCLLSAGIISIDFHAHLFMWMQGTTQVLVLVHLPFANQVVSLASYVFKLGLAIYTGLTLNLILATSKCWDYAHGCRYQYIYF